MPFGFPILVARRAGDARDNGLASFDYQHGSFEMFIAKMLRIIFLVVGLIANSANAELITFDDIKDAGSGKPIQNGYAGLNWNQFYVANAAEADPGYINAVVSTPNVSYNLIGYTATISNTNGFNLISGYFTGPYRDGTVNVTTTGGIGQHKSFSISTASPTLVIFDFYDIKSATFSASGSSFANFALDNLTVTVVPEPQEWVLMILGLGLVVFQVRHVRHKNNSIVSVCNFQNAIGVS